MLSLSIGQPLGRRYNDRGDRRMLGGCLRLYILANTETIFRSSLGILGSRAVIDITEDVWIDVGIDVSKREISLIRLLSRHKGSL